MQAVKSTYPNINSLQTPFKGIKGPMTVVLEQEGIRGPIHAFDERRASFVSLHKNDKPVECYVASDVLYPMTIVFEWDGIRKLNHLRRAVDKRRVSSTSRTVIFENIEGYRPGAYLQ